MFEDEDVREALESIRRAISAGDNPLRDLVLVWQRAQTAGPAVSTDTLDAALKDVLFGVIEESLGRLRELEGREEPENTRHAQLAALSEDFRWGNAELEAWSALYYRYVRLDLDLQVQDIARIVNSVPRQIRRRVARGVHRLAEELSARESKARIEKRRLWRRLKLPPMGYGRLFGLETLKATVVGTLNRTEAPPLVVVAGTGGLGKTTLVHVVMRQVVESDVFADVAWIGLDKPASYVAVLGRMVLEMGFPHLVDQPAEDLERGLRALLNVTRTALVLDNADLLETYPAVLERLSALIGPGKVLATVRQWPGSESPAHIFALDPLSREALGDLIQYEVSERQIGQAVRLSSEALDRLYDVLGGNPLAARLAMGQLAHLPLERVLSNLAGLQTDAGVLLFEALFARTWEALSEEAREVAFALVLIPDEGAFWHDLQLLSGLPEDALDAAITELTSSALLEALGPAPRYATHALTRRYLEEMVRGEDYASRFEGLLQRAVQRVADDFEASDARGVPSQRVGSWLQLLRWQAETGVGSDLMGDFVASIAPGARRSGQWQRWADVLEHIAARLSEDELANVQLEAGVARRWLGDTNGASEALGDAIARFGERGEFVGQSQALIELGALYAGSGRGDEAILAYRRAVDTAERYAVHENLRRALNGLAMLALQNEQIDEALDLLRRALDLFPEQPDAQTLSNLGVACTQAGLTDEAIQFQRDALAQYQADGDLPNVARAHVRLASAYAAAEDYEPGRRHFEEGLAQMRVLGDALGQARTLVNLGVVHREEGRWEDAVLVWHDALALQRHLGDDVGMAYTWYHLGDVQWASREERDARDSLRQALQLAEANQLSTLTENINQHPAFVT